jgi:hypothetical protein
MNTMKKSFITLFLMLFIGLAGLNAQVTCGTELGYSDFPYVDGDQTIGLSTTGSGMSYSNDWINCGITTKPGSIYVGSGPGTFTNTFSIPVNNVVYNFTAADNGEQITVTTDPPGTVSITHLDGTCPEFFIITDNVITVPGTVAGAVLQISSTVAFTSITFSHNGLGGGALFTMCYDASSEVDPTPVPLRWWSLVVVGLMIAGFGLWRVR